jgi:hypothetical protein
VKSRRKPPPPEEDRQRGAEWLGGVHLALSGALSEHEKGGKHRPAQDSMVDLRELARLLGESTK